MINNLYVFKSSNKLFNKGKNSYKNVIKKFKLNNKNKINVNLNGDELYKIRIK